MNRILISYIVSCFLMIACKTETPPFSDQIKVNFKAHLLKADSSLVLDSFTITRIDTSNQRLFNEVEDTTYKLTLYKV